MTEVSTLSKSQLAYQWIKERISNGEYTPGYRLVLATIAGSLDMSVVPVREAIRQLEAEGLVTFQRNIGAHVSMVDDSQYRHSMQALSLLEGAATALAAPHLSTAHIATARKINKQMITLLDDFDPRAFTSLNRQFHGVIFEHCANPRLLELVRQEWGRLGHLRTSTFAFVPERAGDSVAEHEQLLVLIEQGADPAEIERAARSHRSSTLDAYLAHEHPDQTNSLPVAAVG